MSSTMSLGASSLPSLLDIMKFHQSLGQLLFCHISEGTGLGEERDLPKVLNWCDS